MLTESERKWLADSEKWNFKLDIYGNSCFCPSCKHCVHFTETEKGVFCQDAEDIWIYGKQLSECPLIPSKKLLHDAALFEARVAAKLANPRWAVCWNSDSCIEFGGHKDERWVWNCEWCRLKHARLQVEEMMDELPI